MKHSLLIIFCSILLIAVSSCRDEDPPSTVQIVNGSQSTLIWENCTNFIDHSVTVCFIGAKEERCPCNTECFWEGSVDATFHVTTVAGIDTTITLTTNSDPTNLHHSTTVGGKTITFVGTEGITCEDYGKYEKYRVVVTVQ